MSLQERLIVIAHEKSHLQRRDSLLQLLARTLALAHFPYIRKALLAHLHVACEQACDETAARETGDPGKVAELLLKIEKLYHGHFVTKDSLVLGLLGNSTSTLPGRISALLAPVGVARQPANLKLTALVFMLVLLVGHDLLHTALEHAFTLFTGI
jgi:Zn-dependent protease with chaperone function